MDSREREYVLDKIIGALKYARREKARHFRPVEPSTAVHWLSGMLEVADYVQLGWTPDQREPVLAARGLQMPGFGTAQLWYEVEQLRGRGLSDEAVVDELLAIELETWQALQRWYAEPDE
jgi:hypothetical protein